VLLSIALVTEDGRECYVEMPTRGPHLRNADDFVLANVVRQFGRIKGAEVASHATMATLVARFLDAISGDLQLCHDFKLDWRHLSSLLESHPRVLRRAHPYDIAGVAAEGTAGQVAALEAVRSCADPFLEAHHALADARALRAAWLADGENLEERRRLQRRVALGARAL
jgi:hypothetical protein